MSKQKLVFKLLFVMLLCIPSVYAAPTDIPATYEFTFEQDFLTMKDGTRLAVDFYKPVAKTKDEKFPIVLEVLPYRKDDSFASRDYPVYSYFAERGIMGARVDIRGTGASEGVLGDREYSDQELADILEMIDQLAAKPYSNGNIGMMGKSWSAINGMATAMKRPEHLKALIFMHSSIDLYRIDVHGWDGALHLDMFSVEMDIENMMPRAPEYKIDDAYFKNRFDTRPWIFTYLEHQRDGEFWQKDRSLISDYSALNIPVYAVGGLLDGYRDSVPDMLENTSVPIKAEMNTQNHAFPHNGEPGPNYEWRQTAVKWWHHWLNGKDTNIMQEPLNTVFMRDYVPANNKLTMTPGKFWAVKRVPDTTPWTLFLNENKTLDEKSGGKGTVQFKQMPGMADETLNWWGEVTGDMIDLDKRSLVFDSPKMTDTKYILGNPKVQLKTAADQPLLDWIIRLEDVAPDGTVSLITGGLFHSADYISRFDPKDFPVNEFIDIEIPLHYTTWTFKPGHRVRVAVSLFEYPLVWPTPYLSTIQIAMGDNSKLILPEASSENVVYPIMPAVEEIKSRPGVNWIHEQELTPFKVTHYPSHKIDIAEAEESSLWEVDGRKYMRKNTMTYIIDIEDPANATFKSEGNFEIKIGDRVILAKSIMQVTSDKKNFDVKVRREIYENNVLLKAGDWKEVIPRDFQ
jgi:predicted acyl esterase